MALKTYEELFTVIPNLIYEVVEAVSERAKKLLQEHINTDTYGINKTNMGTPTINDSYLDGTGRPSYEFRDVAWDVDLKQQLYGSCLSLFYDSGNMTPPTSSSPFLHGNANINADRREKLAELLNVAGVAQEGDMSNQNPKTREPYWDNFIQELNQKIGGWLFTEFYSRGIKIPALKLYKGTFI